MALRPGHLGRDGRGCSDGHAAAALALDVVVEQFALAADTGPAGVNCCMPRNHCRPLTRAVAFPSACQTPAVFR